MIKKTVKFEDWDGTSRSEELCFHLSKKDVLQELSLIDRMERFKAEVVDAPKRELTTPEKQEMVDLIKTFLRLSYGQLIDGRSFRKSPEIWAEFEGTMAFETYFWLLFTDENEFKAFMTGLLPPDLMAQAKQELGDADLAKLGEHKGYLRKPEKPMEEMSAEELKDRLRQLEG